MSDVSKTWYSDKGNKVTSKGNKVTSEFKATKLKLQCMKCGVNGVEVGKLEWRTDCDYFCCERCYIELAESRKKQRILKEENKEKKKQQALVAAEKNKQVQRQQKLARRQQKRVAYEKKKAEENAQPIIWGMCGGFGTFCFALLIDGDGDIPFWLKIIFTLVASIAFYLLRALGLHKETISSNTAYRAMSLHQRQKNFNEMREINNKMDDFMG